MCDKQRDYGGQNHVRLMLRSMAVLKKFLDLECIKNSFGIVSQFFFV